MELILFVFGFAALMICLYCGVGLVAGVTMMFAVLWKLICLPFALVGAFFNLFRPKARIALPKQTQYTKDRAKG